jgi:hypothetical protein
MTIQTESRKALRELIDLLSEADEHWASPERNLMNADDVVGAHRALLHILESGLIGMFEMDPDRPDFREIVTPSRKLTGDNADAIYFDAPLRDDGQYHVRGNTDGAIYVSLTIEIGSADGSLATESGGIINDSDFDVAADGSFEVWVGGEPRERNWLALPPGASRMTTRHYYEDEISGAANPDNRPFLTIENRAPGPAPEPPNDAGVAAGIRRVAQFVRSRTLDMPMMAENPPPFVSTTPNVFPQPVVPGDFGLSAFDAHYSMAPYVIGPDQALVLRGRWPTCRCANISLWTRHMQTFDYMNRQVSLNRAQTQLDADGGFEMVIAHSDPGHPNWLDTEGRPFGMVFWRFMLVEGEVVRPTAEVVDFAALAAR